MSNELVQLLRNAATSLKCTTSGVEMLTGNRCQADYELAEKLFSAAASLEAQEPVARVEYQGELYGNNFTEEDWDRLEELPDGTPLYRHPFISAAPDGWKLVPVDLTDAMLDAWFDAHRDPSAGARAYDEPYRAMLAAAPQLGGSDSE